MFNKKLSETTFSELESFCDAFAEGVRVEYKSEMIKDIPKTISAFANTLGGIIVIGVTAEKTNNRVIKKAGIAPQVGIEEAILNSALSGIYPSVIPEVKIFEIPSSKNVIIVIKVHESLEAPHAIQNTTRVYVRTGNITQPYDLAEIDRIKYLLERRGASEIRKEELIRSAIKKYDQRSGNPIVRRIRITVSVCPVFPYQPIISLDNLYNFCNLHHPATVKYYSVDNPQSVMDGVIKAYGSPNLLSYREINHYGLVFVREDIVRGKGSWRSAQQQLEPEKFYLSLTQFILAITKTIKLAEAFYQYCGYQGNIEIKVNLENIEGELLMFRDDGFGDIDSTKATDNIAHSSQICGIEDISSKTIDIVSFLLKNILWVFNCKSDPRNRVNEVLKANQIN